MNILRANLKHLYQCRSLWLWYFLLLCQIPLIARPFWSSENEKFVGYLVISSFWALVTISLVKEILNKPFSFCLPGHHKIPRRFIFWIGGVINMVFGLVFLAHTELEFPYVLLVICAGGFMGMLFYLLVVLFIFPVRNNVALIGFLPLVIFLGVFFELYKPLEAMIIYSPVRIIIVGLLICWLTWRWLGQEGLARRYCGQMVIGITDVWNAEKERRYRQARAVEESAKKNLAFADRLNRFFMARMTGSGFLTRSRYIWGNLYVVIGRAIFSSLGLGQWLVIALLFMLMGYFPGREDLSMANILFIMPVFGAVSMNLLPYSAILLPAGRNEKYYASLVSGFTVTLLTMLAIAVIAFISILLEPVLPDIALKGRTFGYHAMNVKYCFVTLSLMPISFAIATLIRRRQFLKMVLSIMLMYGCIGFYTAATIGEIQFNLFILPVLMMISWGISLLILRYVCMRRCLAGGA